MVQISQVSPETPPGQLKKAEENTNPAPQSLPPEEEGDGVIIDLSDEAVSSLEEGEESSRPGKSGQSTAHRARALLQEEAYAALRDLPFGQVVSALARGIDPASLLPPPPPAIDEGEGLVVEEEGIPTEDESGTDTSTTTVTVTADIPLDTATDDPLVAAKAAALSDAEAALQLLSTDDEEEEKTTVL